jgi:hypothetical protein
MGDKNDKCNQRDNTVICTYCREEILKKLAPGNKTKWLTKPFHEPTRNGCTKKKHEKCK